MAGIKTPDARRQLTAWGVVAIVAFAAAMVFSPLLARVTLGIVGLAGGVLTWISVRRYAAADVGFKAGGWAYTGRIVNSPFSVEVTNKLLLRVNELVSRALLGFDPADVVPVAASPPVATTATEKPTSADTSAETESAEHVAPLAVVAGGAAAEAVANTAEAPVAADTPVPATTATAVPPTTDGAVVVDVPVPAATAAAETPNLGQCAYACGRPATRMVAVHVGEGAEEQLPACDECAQPPRCDVPGPSAASQPDRVAVM